MASKVSTALERKAEEALFKLGAVMHLIVAKDFLGKFGEKIASGDNIAFWEAIDEYRVANPGKFVSNVPNLMERNSDGSLKISPKQAEAILDTLVSDMKLSKKQRGPAPDLVDLMERDENGKLKHTSKEADAMINALRDSMK